MFVGVASAAEHCGFEPDVPEQCDDDPPSSAGDVPLSGTALAITEGNLDDAKVAVIVVTEQVACPKKSWM